MGSQGEFASPDKPHFVAKIADFDFKYCILKENAINNISRKESSLT